MQSLEDSEKVTLQLRIVVQDDGKRFEQGNVEWNFEYNAALSVRPVQAFLIIHRIAKIQHPC